MKAGPHIENSYKLCRSIARYYRDKAAEYASRIEDCQKQAELHDRQAERWADGTDLAK